MAHGFAAHGDQLSICNAVRSQLNRGGAAIGVIVALFQAFYVKLTILDEHLLDALRADLIRVAVRPEDLERICPPLASIGRLDAE